MRLDALGVRVRPLTRSGHLLDVVPNHLAADTHGPWWRQLLRDGPDGDAAHLFDVDWGGGEHPRLTVAIEGG